MEGFETVENVDAGSVREASESYWVQTVCGVIENENIRVSELNPGISLFHRMLGSSLPFGSVVLLQLTL